MHPRKLRASELLCTEFGSSRGYSSDGASPQGIPSHEKTPMDELRAAAQVPASPNVMRPYLESL